ncbi:hypothetical protein [Oceanispirochaeta sp.]|uniref:hypothetical protein n=1 Tax=Oceanispirochaeta sp. TaxID=2035350 RepID=UPI00262A4834|nr:hypothetical protein [Oceanispirochaeta sp.]MDA3955386.1 hypothetical protein [Oceanispirochaeta sp.]
MIPSVLFLTNCRSTDNIIEEKSTFIDEYYISRPKIIVDAPIAKLPYTLRWEGSRSAGSYEIQSALDLQFTDSRQNWTTKESSLLLSELKGDVVYIRIRSRTDRDTSRWSEIVKLCLVGDVLGISWVRE